MINMQEVLETNNMIAHENWMCGRSRWVSAS